MARRSPAVCLAFTSVVLVLVMVTDTGDDDVAAVLGGAGVKALVGAWGPQSVRRTAVTQRNCPGVLVTIAARRVLGLVLTRGAEAGGAGDAALVMVMVRQECRDALVPEPEDAGCDRGFPKPGTTLVGAVGVLAVTGAGPGGVRRLAGTGAVMGGPLVVRIWPCAGVA